MKTYRVVSADRPLVPGQFRIGYLGWGQALAWEAVAVCPVQGVLCRVV